MFTLARSAVFGFEEGGGGEKGGGSKCQRTPHSHFCFFGKLSLRASSLGERAPKRACSQAMANCLYGRKRLILPKELVTC